MSCQDTAQITGQHILFCGTSTQTWTLAQFTQAAQFAKAHGVDSLLVKVADGTYKWYGGLAGYQAIKNAIHAEGVGCIPYTYSYGNTYGDLDTEIDILISYMQDSGVVCADMESEWNGQVGWAQHLASRMSSLQGVFLVSTWADPSMQNWSGVIQALNPCVSAYMPQQYTSFLETFWQEFGELGAKCLQPTLDMTQDFGPNDPVSLAQSAHSQGHTAISIWYYETAAANPGLLDQVLAAFPKTIQEETMTSIDLTNGTVASHFTGSDTIWKCKDNGFFIGHAILAFYQQFGGTDLCGLTFLGLPTSNETAVPGHPGVVYQRFERAVVIYDPTHVLDNPPGAGSVYLAHIDSGFGEDPKIPTLQGEVTALQSQVTQLQTLLASSNLGQIGTLAKQIQDDVALIMKLSVVQ
jgi:hypothetical protein